MDINFKAAIEKALIGFYVSTVDGKFKFANKHMLKIFGYNSIEELKRLYIPEDIYASAEDRDAFIKKLREKGYVEAFQIKVKKKNGEIIDIIVSGQLFDNYRLEGWIVDVTEREKLLQRIKLHNRIIEENSDAIFITDRNGLIVYTNSKFEELMGSIPDITYAKELIPVSTEHLKKYKELNKAIIKKGVWTGELEVIGKNNKIIPCGVKIFTLLDSKGKVENYISVYRDISEKKALQDQLKHSQKMEILGELAGSVIHDMNNILMSIGYNTELIAMVQGKNPEKTKKYLNNIEKTIKNAQDILKKFSMLSKKSQVAKLPISVSTLLKDLIVMVSPLVKKKNIEINFNDTTNNSKILGNKSSFIQAILNLVINAIDAIEAVNRPNGLITLNANIIDIDNRRFVRITLQDNGAGMEQEVMDKIFEPFYTTKGAKGTGLGLAIVYREIKELNGDISVSSEKGEGTKFNITLPVHIDNSNEFMEINDKKSDKDFDRLIYLMDDDKIFSGSIREYLEFYGFKVMEFDEAEKLYKQLTVKTPDILLLDFVLDGSLTGEDVLKFIERNNLKFTVVVLSGLVDATITDLKNYDNVKAIIQKPISGKDLLQKLNGIDENN